MTKTTLLSSQVELRAKVLFDRQQLAVYRRTDQMFSVLLVCQWLAGLAVALLISPKAWAGRYSDVHVHVWAAFLLGGLIIAWPVFLALTRPGEAMTRHVIAVGQMVYSALLIHLTGGRIETHFHIFGSLAFLSFYRDWRVLISASAVAAIDHLLRGIFFPLSVYGVATVEPWRWLEHLWWMAFEDFFLIRTCLRNVEEMRLIARRQAEAEEINVNIEALVDERTEDLSRAKTRLALQYEVELVLGQAATLNDAIVNILQSIGTTIFGDDVRFWGAFWTDRENRGSLSCAVSLQIPTNSLNEFEKDSKTKYFSVGKGLPGLVSATKGICFVEDASKDGDFTRQQSAKMCGLNSGFAFPIINRGTTLGVMEFFTERYYQLDDDTREIVLVLGRQIGRLIAYKSLESDRQRLANVVQYSSDAIFTTSIDGLITSWNRGAEQLFGYEAVQSIGKKAEILIPEHRQEEFHGLWARAKKGEHIDNFETEFITHAGKRVAVSLSWALLCDDSATEIGFSLTVRDITERKEAERRVNEFYSIVSHELRTPLTSIRGAIGLIEGNVLQVDETKELLEAARGSADRLIRLINDMLDLKKVESGNMSLNLTEIEVGELVSQSLYALTGMAEEAGVKLRFEWKSLPPVYADCDKAIQIITNLVSNAIKYSPRGAEVYVVTDLVENKAIRFQVIDHGPGIEATDTGKLFEKFRQLDSSDSRQRGGTGLGLAITKALVLEHGGAIGVESELGRGSAFWFELPIFMGNTGSQNVFNDVTQVKTPAEEKALTVLLVGENRELASSFESCIAKRGDRVILAETFDEAKRSITNMIPNIVVYDLALRDGTFLDFMESVQEKDRAKNLPVIVIADQPKQKARFANRMIADWLHKPIDGQILAAAVDRVLSLERLPVVLVADNDPTARRVIIAQLKAIGVSCIEARDGEEVLQCTRSASADLIILEVDLPKRDAFQIVDILREKDPEVTPIVIYTSRDLSESERRRLDLGVTRHLIKGHTSILELVRIVRELLDGLLLPINKSQKTSKTKITTGAIE